MTREARGQKAQISRIRAAIRANENLIARKAKEFQELGEVIADDIKMRNGMKVGLKNGGSSSDAEAKREVDRELEIFELRIAATKDRMEQLKKEIEKLEKINYVKRSAIDGIINSDIGGNIPTR